MALTERLPDWRSRAVAVTATAPPGVTSSLLPCWASHHREEQRTPNLSVPFNLIAVPTCIQPTDEPVCACVCILMAPPPPECRRAPLFFVRCSAAESNDTTTDFIFPAVHVT